MHLGSVGPQALTTCSLAAGGRLAVAYGVYLSACPTADMLPPPAHPHNDLMLSLTCCHYCPLTSLGLAPFALLPPPLRLASLQALDNRTCRVVPARTAYRTHAVLACPAERWSRGVGCRRRRQQPPIATFDDPSAVVLPPLCLLPVGCPAIVCGGHCCRGERVNNHSATRYTLQGAYSSSQWDR